jgi:N-acyl-D-amino-acid deacylase
VAVGTDGCVHSPSGVLRKDIPAPHPRFYGTFPRVLGRYTHERGILHLSDAIRKMTSLPAQRFSILDHGLLRPGMYADITMLDPDRVIDKGTYENPHQYPKGIPYAVVNGKVTVDNGKFNKVLAGRTLRKRA